MTMDEIRESIDDLFTPEELAIYDNVTPSAIDIEALKKTGNITVAKQRENGMIIETINYTSFDGKVAFTKVQSYYERDELQEKVNQLNELTDAAVKREDYESAAKFTNEKKSLIYKKSK